MKKMIMFLPVLLFLSCEMDSFLFNSQELDEYTLPGNTIPESLIQPVTLNSDGNTLYGFWVKANEKAGAKTILYCHGNRDHIDHYWDRVMLLHELHMNIFVWDYRGYGKSEGEASEQGLYRDGEVALDFVLNDLKVPVDSLVVFGYSLGNAVSIYLSAKKVDPLCLIAESPWASSTSLAQGSSVLDIQDRWLTEGTYNNAELIKEIATPFLLLHGTDDDLIRFRDNGRVVYENAPQPKSLRLVQGANHTDIPQVMSEQSYLHTIRDWIQRSENL